MRFSKRKDEPASPEEVAAARRMQAVTDRGRSHAASYLVPEEPAEGPGPKRQFTATGDSMMERRRA